MAQTIAWSGPHVLAPVLIALCGFTPAATEAAVDTRATATADSSLDGWGPYKFGMTAEQMRSIDEIPWRRIGEYPGVPVSSLRSDVLVADFDQLGLKHWKAVAEFDGEKRLSSIFLDYHRGGLTEEGCKMRFEGLLAQLEAQYGAFRPGDDEWHGSDTNLSKTDETRSIPGSQSLYRDIIRWNIIGSNINDHDTKLFKATAKLIYDERSIAVGMGVVENPKPLGFVGQEIPKTVLALAPNLADPLCSLSVAFRSKNPVLQQASPLPVTPPAPLPPLNPPPASGAGPAGQLQYLQSTINAGAPPSQFASAANAFFDAAKKAGLLGPIDPMLDAYIRARSINDDEDEAALLAKMTPAQTAGAAYIRHDYPLAIKLWTPLAEKGDVEGAAEIASLYEYGLNGVTKDYVQAVKWRKLAASEGDGSSQATLGEDYAEGQGVSKDKVRAYMWLSIGIEQVSDGPSKTLFPDHVAKERDAVAQQMSLAELARAKAMITRCDASKYKRCD